MRRPARDAARPLDPDDRTDAARPRDPDERTDRTVPLDFEVSVGDVRGRTRTDIGPGMIFARGALLAERYRVTDLLGIGGMGMVYRAFDEQLGLEVAIKVLRPELAGDDRFQQRFRHEVILARQVSHPNVVRLHDLGRHEDFCFLTMDYVPGRSLREILEHEGALAPERAVDIVRQLATALAVAHDEGVVHRDLKPGNVLITDDGKAYITDFGIARSLTEAGLTQSGAVVGTLDYLSPEQARGEPVDGRSDLYALGLILFEMLSGERPFSGGSQAEIVAQRIVGRPRELSEAGVEAPRAVREVLGRLLEREPERRFASAHELIAVLEGRATAALPWRPPRWLVPGLVAALALTIAAVAFLWRGDRPPAEKTSSAVERRHAVAVLPLVDDTGRADLAWAADGLAERLAEELADWPLLGVTDSLRVFRLLADLGQDGTVLDAAGLRELASLLEVDRLVTGRLRTVDDESLALELALRGADGEPLETSAELAAAGDVAELYAAVGMLADALARELEAAGAGGEAATHPEPPSPEAARAYALGLEQLAAGDVEAAAERFGEATEADPGFARAWARLAEAHLAAGQEDRALAAAERAVETAGEDGRLALETGARLAFLRGEAEEAQTRLEELSERFPNAVEARIALAEAYGEAGQLEDAVRLLGELTEAAPGHPRAWYLLAKYSIRFGNSRQAVDEYLVRALILTNKLGDERGRGDALNALGVAYERLGQLEEAIDNYEKAARIRERIGDHRGFAVTLRNLAAAYSIGGEPERARPMLERARALLEEMGDPTALAELYDVYGVLEEELGRYRQALEHYRRALKLQDELGDQVGLADSFNNVGFAYYMLGEYDNAMVYWRQALELRQAGGDRRGAVLAEQSIGLLQLARGEWEEAAASFREALESSRDLQMQPAAAVSLGNLGRVAQLQGRYRDAFASYGQALSLLRRLEDLRGLVEFTLFESGAWLEVEGFEQARTRLAQVREWLAEAPNRAQLAHLRILEGELARRQGRLGEARAAYAEALAAAKASESLVSTHRAGIGLALVTIAQGRPAQAAQSLRGVSSEIELKGNALLALLLAEGRARAELAAGDHEASRATLRGARQLLRRVGPYGGAYRLHRLEALARAAAGVDAGPAWQEAEDEVERLLENLEDPQRTLFRNSREVESIVERNAADAA